MRTPRRPSPAPHCIPRRRPIRRGAPLVLAVVAAAGLARPASAQAQPAPAVVPPVAAPRADSATTGDAAAPARPATTPAAARPAVDRIAGVVRTAAGRPIPEATVVLLSTLEAARTDATGRFALATVPAPGDSLVVRRLGYAERRLGLDGPGASPAAALTITLDAARPALAPITVLAGRHTAGAERGATLTALEVATTPGTTADVNRAIQTLPGVQPVDEGTALFVRGGDFTETRTFVNGAATLTPPQLLTPTGTYGTTVDPFQMDGIFFSSGGFGARYGNALSAVVDLTTRGRPTGPNAQLGLGLAGPSLAAGTTFGARGGAWVAGNRFDVAPILAVNGAPREFRPPPRGHEVAASASWLAGPRGERGELRLYALDARTRLGVTVEDPGRAGTYAADEGDRLVVLSWRGEGGRVITTANASLAGLARDEAFGPFRLTTRQTIAQASLGAAWAPHPRLDLRGGSEVERLGARLAGALAPLGAATGDAGAQRLFEGARAGVRDAVWAEADWRALSGLRLVAGARTDRSSLTGVRTVDPRLSAAWRVRGGVTVTGAWGLYHQVPDPMLFDPVLGVPRPDGAALAPMRARQTVLGLQLGEGARMLRVELFDKRYRDLALFGTEPGRPLAARAHGVGRAYGFDLIARATGPWRLERRTTYSFVRAERTDAVTGLVARAPSDVTHAVTSVVERPFGTGWRAGVAWRTATGRPFTPVTGGTWDPTQGRWLPVWGAPTSARFPAFHRLDLSLSRFVPLGARASGVLYLSVTNVLDRRNVQAWRYSDDYAERAPVRSVFNRAAFVGATLLLR